MAVCATAAAVLLLVSAVERLAQGMPVGDYAGADHWLTTDKDAPGSPAVKRGRTSRTLVRREEAPEPNPIEIEPVFLTLSEQDTLSPSPSLPFDSPSPSPLMLPGAFQKKVVETSDKVETDRLPLGHSDIIYAVGSEDKAVYAQRASTMSPGSNWTKVAAGKVLSVASEGDNIFAVRGDGRVYGQSLSATTPSSSWGQPLSRGQVRTLAVTHSYIYAILEDGMLYKQHLPLDADRVQDWELASQILPDRNGWSVLIQGDTVYVVKNDSKVYRQPLGSMTEESSWIPTSQVGVTSLAIVKDVFYGLMRDTCVHAQSASRLDLLTNWGNASSAQGVESITSPWIRSWQTSQADVAPAYGEDHFKALEGKKHFSQTVNVSIINPDIEKVPQKSSVGFESDISRNTTDTSTSEKNMTRPLPLVSTSSSSPTDASSSPAPPRGKDIFVVASGPALTNASLHNSTYLNLGSSTHESSTGSSLGKLSSAVGATVSSTGNLSATSSTPNGSHVLSTGNLSADLSTDDGSNTSSAGNSSANSSMTGGQNGLTADNSSASPSMTDGPNEFSAGNLSINSSMTAGQHVSSTGNLSANSPMASGSDAISAGNLSANSSAVGTSNGSPAPGPPILPSSIVGYLDLDTQQTPEDFLGSTHSMLAVKEGIALAALCGSYSVDIINFTGVSEGRLRPIGGVNRPVHSLLLYFRLPVPHGLTAFNLIKIMANSSLTKIGARIRSCLHHDGLNDEVFAFGLTAEVNMTGATPLNPWVYPPVQIRLSANGTDSGGVGTDITTTTTTGGYGGLEVRSAADPFNPDLDDPVEDALPTTTVLQSMFGPAPVPAALRPQEQQIVRGTLQFVSSNAEEVVENGEAHNVVLQELATAADVPVKDISANFGYTTSASAALPDSLHVWRSPPVPGYVDVEYTIVLEGNHSAAGIQHALLAADHGEMVNQLETGFLAIGYTSMMLNITSFTHEIRSITLIGPQANLTRTNASQSASTSDASEDNETSRALEDSIIPVDQILPAERHSEKSGSSWSRFSAVFFLILPLISAPLLC